MVKNYFFSILWIVIVALIINSNYADAQQTAIDSRGTDFWLSFIPNYHDNSGLNPNTDSLYIFITCNKATSGTITFYDNNGNIDNVPFLFKPFIINQHNIPLY